jgi:pimeloyl-ACP methyl ester carboxylesterase
LRKLAEVGGETEMVDTPAGRLRLASRGARGNPQLVVVHGLGDSIAGWAQAALPLLARFRVHLLELPGHGLSQAPPDFRQETLLDGLRAVLARFPDARLVGHSLGAWLLVKLLLRGALSPRELVLINPAGAALSREEWAPFQSLILARDAPGARAYLRRAFHRPPRALEWFPGEVLRQMRAPAIASFLSAVQESDFLAPGALASLTCKTRLVWGESDRLLPQGTLDFWKRELVGARLVLLAKAGHLPHLERPLALARAIAAPF